MTARALPAADRLTICFAHAAYCLQQRFALRGTGLRSFEVRSPEDLRARIGEADVLVASGLWRNELVQHARQLVLIQSVSAGTDQFSQEALGAAGVRLASAQGVNERAVAEHAIALMLAIARKLPQARDHQTAHHWRGMVAGIANREDEISGKTLVIVGLGRIGSRLARLAKAFDMRVIGVRRDPGRGADGADAVVAQAALLDVLPQADFVALTCPLNDSTRGLIGSQAFAAMRPTAVLINVARGRVVDEPALVDALRAHAIGGAALDCVWDEPLPAASPLWDLPNVLVTPHTAGETQAYEDNVLDLLLENLRRLWRGEHALKNQVV
jgi:D-2-hydroxyacid dehydrogenase (NADP+)